VLSPLDSPQVQRRCEALALPSETERKLDEAQRGPVRRRALSLRALPRNLRMARRVRLAALRPEQVRLDATDVRVPDCVRCEDNCCRGPGTGVALRLSDIARLLDAGLGEAIDPDARWTDEDYARDPALRQLEALDSQRRFPKLRRDETGRCVFLDDEQRCAVHAIRPLVCRAFPYRLAPELDRVHFSNRCASWRDDGEERERDEMTAAVLEMYNAKVRDLVVLEHGRRELDALGIGRYLPIVD
jgi:Fe-S-cluster containining protein